MFIVRCALIERTGRLIKYAGISWFRFSFIQFRFVFFSNCVVIYGYCRCLFVFTFSRLCGNFALCNWSRFPDFSSTRDLQLMKRANRVKWQFFLLRSKYSHGDGSSNERELWHVTIVCNYFAFFIFNFISCRYDNHFRWVYFTSYSHRVRAKLESIVNDRLMRIFSFSSFFTSSHWETLTAEWNFQMHKHIGLCEESKTCVSGPWAMLIKNIRFTLDRTVWNELWLLSFFFHFNRFNNWFHSRLVY